MIVKDRRHPATDLVLYVIWQQYISGLCSELVPLIIIFPSTSKRLMSPQNSTRKVNTILKCQEINDIYIFFFLWFCRRGWQMSCPFHSVPPICDLPFILSNSIFSFFLLFFCSSLSLSPPDHGLQMTRTHLPCSSSMPLLRAATQCSSWTVPHAVWGCQWTNSIDPSSFRGDEISTRGASFLSDAETLVFLHQTIKL